MFPKSAADKFLIFKIASFIFISVVAVVLLALGASLNPTSEVSVAAASCQASCYGFSGTVPVGFSCMATDYTTCQQCAATGKMVKGSQYCAQTVCYGHCFTEPSCSINYEEGTQCTGLDYRCYYCQNGKFLTTSQTPCTTENVKALRQYTCSGSALTVPPGPPPTKSSSSSSKSKAPPPVVKPPAPPPASSLSSSSTVASSSVESSIQSSSSSSIDNQTDTPNTAAAVLFLEDLCLGCGAVMMLFLAAMIVWIIFRKPAKTKHS